MVSSSSSGGMKSHAPRPRKRVDVEDAGGLKRAANGSAFTRCENCNKDIPVAIADMHECGSDMKTKARLLENVSKPTQEPPKKKVGEKRERTVAEKKKSKKSKTEGKKKDPNMPKRPMTAFFLFMEDFRTTKKEDKSATAKASEITKLGGERWKEMTEEEKVPYNQKAAKLKLEYEAAMKKYKSGGSKDDGDDDGKEGETDNEVDEEGEQE